MATIDDFRLTPLGGRVFALSLPIRPGSVRDSMWRAETFCDQLRRAGFVAQGSHALVVGSGPTGMTVTGALLRSGARVVSCNVPPEADDESLSACYTRVICPTTYDFPASHWRGRTYPLTHSRAVLPWRADIARDVHNRLVTSLHELTEPHYAAGDYYHAEPAHLVSLRPDGDHVKVVVEHAGRSSSPASVQLVIVCTGPGKHLNLLPAASGIFVGFGFWSNSDPVLRAPQSAARQKVLVLGGGDGGVGDFVRLLTGEPDTFDILDRMQLPQPVIEELAEINSATWTTFGATNRANDHELLTDVQVRLIAAVDRAWANDPHLQRRVSALLLPDDQRPFVQLAVPCYHFAHSYVANRVAAQFLARALASCGAAANGHLAPFRVGVRYTNMRGTDGHPCGTQACRDTVHEVSFKRAVCRQYVATGPPAYVVACCAPVAAPTWKATTTDDVSSHSYRHIIPRFGSETKPSRLPSNVLDAIRDKSDPPLRDVPPFYTL